MVMETFCHVLWSHSFHMILIAGANALVGSPLFIFSTQLCTTRDVFSNEWGNYFVVGGKTWCAARVIRKRIEVSENDYFIKEL